MGSAGIQGPLWDAAAGDWARIQEAWHLPLWRDALRAAGVGPGVLLLDAGCGAGGAAAEAAAMGCDVAGVDASAALLAVARKRLPRARFVRADLEALPFPDRAFDAVVAINSVIFASDMPRAASECARVARPGGRVVITCRGRPEESDMTAVSKAVAEFLPEALRGGGPFALADPGALEALVGAAGLRLAGTGESRCLYRYPDLETSWRGIASAGPMRAAIAHAGEGRVRAAVMPVLRRHAGAHGAVELRVVYLWAAGERR